MSNFPIIICGMARSGTSLLRNTIGSHPDLAVYENDLEFWQTIYPENREYWGVINNIDLALQIVRSIYSNHVISKTKLVPDRRVVENRLMNIELDAIGDFAILAGRVFEAYIDEYRKLRGRKRWGLKTPENEFFLEEILSVHPEARFIQIIRDPIQMLSSRKKNGYFGDCSEISDIQIIQTITKWNRSIEILADTASRYPDNCFGLGYMHFVEDAETYLKIICRFIDLEFQPDMLEMKGHSSEWKGNNSSFSQKNSGISLELASKPITNLSERERNLVDLTRKIGESQLSQRYPGKAALHQVEAKFLYTAGLRILKKGHVEEAMMAFSKAFSLDNTFERPLVELANIQAQHGGRQEALKNGIAALKINEINSDAILLCHKLLKDSDQAGEIEKVVTYYLEKFPHEKRLQRPKAVLSSTLC